MLARHIEQVRLIIDVLSQITKRTSSENRDPNPQIGESTVERDILAKG